MSRLSHDVRTICLASLPVLLLAASWAPLVQVPQQFDPQRFRVNEGRWRALPESTRQELRRKWQQFSDRSDADRELTMQRMEVLRRMIPPLRRILGRDPRQAELSFQLDQVEVPLKVWLAAELDVSDMLDAAALQAAAELEIRERITAFLDDAVSRGDLPPGERNAIVAQPLSLLVRDGLLQLAASGAGAAREDLLGAGAGSGPGATDIDSLGELVRESEREALENSRLPEAHGKRGGNESAGGDPLRLRRYRMTYVVPELRKVGLSDQEIYGILSLPLPDIEHALAEHLAPR